jgi:MoxR-like ATPase
MDGRRYVIPDDVKAIAESCLNHRLLLSPDADMDESSTHDIVRRIISSVKVPLEEK